MLSKNRARPRRRVKLKRLLLLLFLLVVLMVAGIGARNYLIYGKLLPGIAGEAGEGKKPDPDPGEKPGSEEKPDPEEEPEPPGQEEPTPGLAPSPTSPEQLYLVADGDYLMALVTKQTTLGKYAPQDIVPLPDWVCHKYKYHLRQEAADHLLELWEAAREEGVELKVVSAYRSYETQEQLFNDYAAYHGVEVATKFSARPGQSEHQLGTTVDFGGTEVDFKDSFADTPQGQWLEDHAHEFGFVMSYPPGSEGITGYIYEPWHFRYIGVEMAREWKESGEILCEFLWQRSQQHVILMP